MNRALLSLTVALLASTAAAQQTSDSGTLTLTARVSGYVDIASAGAVTLTGALGGGVTGNTAKGSKLSGVTVSLGDLSPANPNDVVRAVVPLRLRSNIAYTLSVSSPGFSNADPLALQSSDVGFGIGNIQRTDAGVNAQGTDSPVAATFGDPYTGADANASSPRWDFPVEKSLAYYASSRAVLSGARIMNVVPAGYTGGLTLDAYFVVKPQFFTPGDFTTTVSFTISTP